MKKQMLIINGRLPGRNESEKAARTSWATGANLKNEYRTCVLGMQGAAVRAYKWHGAHHCNIF